MWPRHGTGIKMFTPNSVSVLPAVPVGGRCQKCAITFPHTKLSAGKWHLLAVGKAGRDAGRDAGRAEETLPGVISIWVVGNVGQGERKSRLSHL